MTLTRIACLSAFVIICGLVPSTQSHAQTNIFSSPTADYFKNATSASRFSSQRFRNRVYNEALPTNLQGASGNSIFSNRNSSLGIASKPFANVRPQSNLSPYLNLGGLPAGGATNYHSLVRPQLEQQQRAAQVQQRRSAQQSSQAQSVAARAPYELRGASDLMPTGHGSVYQNTAGRFLNYGGYFQGPRIR